MRSFAHCLILLLLAACSTTPPVVYPEPQGLDPRVMISPQGWNSLARYEENRLDLCFEIEKIYHRSLNPQDPADLLIDSEKQEEFFVSICNPNQISFVASEVKEKCSPELVAKSKICQAYSEWQEDPEGFWEGIFLPTVDNVMTEKMYNPWQIVHRGEGPSSTIAVTHLQQGNVFIEMNVNLIPEETALSLFGEGFNPNSLAGDYEFRVTAAGGVYIPVVRILLVTPGLTGDVLDYRVFFSYGGHLEQASVFDPTEIKVDHQGFNVLYIPLTRDFVSLVEVAETIIFQGEEERAPDKGAVISFSLEKGKADQVFSELLAHYKAIGSEISKD